MRQEADGHASARSGWRDSRMQGDRLSLQATASDCRMLSPSILRLLDPRSPTRVLLHVSRLLSDDKPPELRQKIEAFEEEKPLNPRSRLKTLVRYYGTTVVVVHVSISLISLGTCYSMVKAGLPIDGLINGLGLMDAAKAEYLTTGSTFTVAYVIHKCLMPVRISTTAVVTPIIVKTLRKKGILKPLEARNSETRK